MCRVCMHVCVLYSSWCFDGQYRYGGGPEISRRGITQSKSAVVELYGLTLKVYRSKDKTAPPVEMIISKVATVREFKEMACKEFGLPGAEVIVPFLSPSYLQSNGAPKQCHVELCWHVVLSFPVGQQKHDVMPMHYDRFAFGTTSTRSLTRCWIPCPKSLRTAKSWKTTTCWWKKKTTMARSR